MNPEIFSWVESVKDLSKQAVNEYTVLVEQVISEKFIDTQYIEQVLDGLLNFGFDQDILTLYKKLCRYYFEMNPSVTIEYVNAYREMWDEGMDNK